MSQAIIIIRKIIGCPECRKHNKSKFFNNDKDLNIHLKMKHDSSYKVKILAGGSASFIPRIS